MAAAARGFLEVASRLRAARHVVFSTFNDFLTGDGDLGTRYLDGCKTHFWSSKLTTNIHAREASHSLFLLACISHTHTHTHSLTHTRCSHRCSHVCAYRIFISTRVRVRRTQACKRVFSWHPHVRFVNSTHPSDTSSAAIPSPPLPNVAVVVVPAVRPRVRVSTAGLRQHPRWHRLTRSNSRRWSLTSLTS